MQTRRRVLLAGISGTVALLSGCSGDTNGTPTESGSTTTATQASTTATESTLPYEKEWNDITVEKGSGWIHEIPAFEKQAELSYTVTNTSSVNFDVYVFEKGFNTGFDKYKEYINNGENADGATGVDGATDEHADEQAESSGVPLTPGEYAIVVDHSNFKGGLNRARPDEESPDTLTIDISLKLESALSL